MEYLVILAALVLVGLLVYPLARRLLVRSAVEGALEGIGKEALGKQPDRVVLVHQNLHSWKEDPAVARFADPLFSKGFQEGGLFSIREMPGVMVRFLLKSAECVVAMIFIHPKAGAWLDLATYYQDGRSATFSTHPDPGLEQRPGHPIVYAPGAAAPALYARIIGERPKGVLRPLMPEDLVGVFQKGYAESIAWRKSRGISAAEVAKVAQRKAG